MTAFFIATIHAIKDADTFRTYAEKSGSTIVAAGGEILVRGKLQGAIIGSADHQMAAVASFPSLQALEGWAASPDYQALVSLRDAGADMTIATYEVPS